MNDPFHNPPPNKKLLGNLSKYYSRRINVQHRLVYEIIKNTDGTIDANENLYKMEISIKGMLKSYESGRIIMVCSLIWKFYR